VLVCSSVARTHTLMSFDWYDVLGVTSYEWRYGSVCLDRAGGCDGLTGVKRDRHTVGYYCVATNPVRILAL